MSGYAADHAGARADVRAAGAPVVWTLTTPGTLDPATGLLTGGGMTTVSGFALRTRGVPERYAALGLVESEAPSFLFAPDEYGAVVPLGARMTFGGIWYTARDVDLIAPDGTAILCRVVAAR